MTHLKTSDRLPTQQKPQRPPFLVQRLQRPYGTAPWAFGGGGTQDTWEAVNRLDGCFSFDYMGAAEYEFGAFPKALKLLKDHRLVLVTFPIGVHAVHYNHGKRVTMEFERQVWGVFPALYAESIAEWVRFVASQDYYSLNRQDPRSIRPPRDHPQIGWDHRGQRYDTIGGFCEDRGSKAGFEHPPFAYFTDPLAFACFAHFLDMKIPPEWMESREWKEAAERAEKERQR